MRLVGHPPEGHPPGRAIRAGKPGYNRASAASWAPRGSRRTRAKASPLRDGGAARCYPVPSLHLHSPLRDGGAAVNLSLGDFPYPSRRMPVLATRGVVATSEPLAAQAGLAMLQRGGNAVDAAVATAIALTVVEPTSNGIGADAFALVWDGRQLHGLNGSGRSPAGLTLQHFQERGLTEVPPRGWLPVTVPGAPAAWRDLHRRFGKLPFAALFEPAIVYARDGYPLAPVVANGWGAAAQNYAE